jgi:hypothetical protein
MHDGSLLHIQGSLNYSHHCGTGTAPTKDNVLYTESYRHPQLYVDIRLSFQAVSNSELCPGDCQEFHGIGVVFISEISIHAAAFRRRNSSLFTLIRPLTVGARTCVMITANRWGANILSVSILISSLKCGTEISGA